MATRIRTLNFLPEIFKTETNAQFLAASLDQIVQQPDIIKSEGYIGSKFGNGVDARGKYVVEPTKTRQNYQLAPGVVFTSKDSSVAQDFISYPEVIDSVRLNGGITNNHNRLWASEYYSWDSLINLDMLINFNQYYWLPDGPTAVTVAGVTSKVKISDIVGQTSYTSENGVVFTNGLKVVFDNVDPASYDNVQYYVQGVGTGIELIPVSEMIAPEAFTLSEYLPWSSIPWDAGRWDIQFYVPRYQDYITISRQSDDRNAWSRSNMWFHVDVIRATAEYNKTPEYVNEVINAVNRAKRPIIEFYPDLKLFNSGVRGKPPVDFIDFRTTDAFTNVAGQYEWYPDVDVFTQYTATMSASVAIAPNIYRSTITIPTGDIDGIFKVGQYVADVQKAPAFSVLPLQTQIVDYTANSTTTTLVVEWPTGTMFPQQNNVSIVANNNLINDFELFDGARIIFAADTNPNVRNKIYNVHFTVPSGGIKPVITLTVADDGQVVEWDQTVITRGSRYRTLDFWFDGDQWLRAQQKFKVNQTPFFDIFDENGVSFSDQSVYNLSSFNGCTLFQYGIGTGPDDLVLGFPLRYDGLATLGDISFDVTFNSDVFDYTVNNTMVEKNVRDGYVHSFTSRYDYNRFIGWQTAVAESVQPQIFEFEYNAPRDVTETCNVAEFGFPAPPVQYTTLTCDIAALPQSETVWPPVQLYFNNVRQDPSTYTYTTDATKTFVTFPSPLVDTPIEISIISDQVSETGYYDIPINLNNNPFNENLTSVSTGDIRGHYQSIFYNSPGLTGNYLGNNNYRDVGNNGVLVKYGNRIIQNSASFVLPAALMRDSKYNLFDALQYNANSYVNFKNLLVGTVNNSAYVRGFTPAYMLDDALDQITASKSDTAPFFWSDMLPSRAPYYEKTYNFANALSTSQFPLTRIYDFNDANYYGVLVYLIRTQNNITREIQLLSGVDYTISETAPTVIVTRDLIAGDKIVIREYNQTYGSYIPNTPTKMGLYPAFKPGIVLDNAYSVPTYFIRGHDGSYTKLYGELDDDGYPIDFRDQVLLEFETRIYNNLKLDGQLPIDLYTVEPGFWRNNDYSYNEFIEMYSTGFLNWIGQNRLEYFRQLYNPNNEFTYNYRSSSNVVNGETLDIGFWRGVYLNWYDTTRPDEAPWEMLHYTDKPSWWDAYYGPAPYTSENTLLWADLSRGYDYNNGTPRIIESAIRPQLLQAIPVDTAGVLLSPFDSIVANYINRTLRRDWVVGDVGPVEFGYRRSSTWPFDLMRLTALQKPAKFYNLGVDVDNYKYNTEFNQYLVNNRSHLDIRNLEVYGDGTAKNSYLNWIVDYEKQFGIDSTADIETLFDTLDVRLVYRMAGYSDKKLLKFYLEKSTPNVRTASLLIPDESFRILLHNNQPFDRIVYSAVIIQQAKEGFRVFGNSQDKAYFKTLVPKINGNYATITVENVSVNVPNDYTTQIAMVPYSTEYSTLTEVAQFLAAYGKQLESQGAKFNAVEDGLEVNWQQMVAEFLYWSQSGWDIGSIITINPAATNLTIEKDSYIVQPLTLQKQNFILNQDLYPISNNNLAIYRENTTFNVKTLNQGDTIAYGQFNIHNFEHGIVFDNYTLFNDQIYRLLTGSRQYRILARGSKTASWNGTVDAAGFIINQDNINEWVENTKYTAGMIVKYKNKYWIATKIIQPALTFDESVWKVTDYEEIQKGLLPNSSTNSYESTLYYNLTSPNLERDADLLSYSLIGFRPRDYMASADLTDVTQVNVYRNFIEQKGTPLMASLFKGAKLQQGGIDYDIYENWQIKTGEFGGVLNHNFIEVVLNEKYLTGNPAILALKNGMHVDGAQQCTNLYELYNYGQPVADINILPITTNPYNNIFTDAGYVSFDDVKTYSYFYFGLPNATYPLSNIYTRDFIWVADFLGGWTVLSPTSLGFADGTTCNGGVVVTSIVNNIDGTATVFFNAPHGLQKTDPFAIINFSDAVNGYYIANEIIDPYSVLVTLTTNNFSNVLTGNGIALKFTPHRVDTPGNIQTLPLLDREFVSNKVWVDTGIGGGWTVYEKTLNYKYQNDFTSTSTMYGTSVAANKELGILISDLRAGSVQRYVYQEGYQFNGGYVPVDSVSEIPGFGYNLIAKGTTLVVTRPGSSVFIYELIDDGGLGHMQLVQQINSPGGSATWASSIELSGDRRWLFIGDVSETSETVSVYTGGSTFSGVIYNDTLIVTDIDRGRVEAGQNVAGLNIVPGTSITAAAAPAPYVITGITPDAVAGAAMTEFVVDAVAPGPWVPGMEVTITGAFPLYYNGTWTVSSGTSTQFTVKVPTTVSPGAATLFGNVLGLGNGGVGFYTVTPSQSGFGVLTGTNFVNVAANLPVSGFSNPPVLGDRFGTSISSNYDGTVVAVSAPSKDYTGVVPAMNDWGYTYVFQRLSQNFEYDGVSAPSFQLIWTATVDSDVVVMLNGRTLSDTDYDVNTVAGVTTVTLITPITYGDVINVSGKDYAPMQTLTTEATPRIGVKFGRCIAMNTMGTELLVGAPFELSPTNQEGAVYRYTLAGAKYGKLAGVGECFVPNPTPILINGYRVDVSGDAASIAAQVNAFATTAPNNLNITNIRASADTVNNILTIELINPTLGPINNKLVITTLDDSVFEQLGMTPYTQTQIIRNPHNSGTVQFGTTVKFNESNSVVISAPFDNRYAATTFDYTDDYNQDNDTIFDNNATQFLDIFRKFGAVYMYDYLGNYEESLDNNGAYVYAQSASDITRNDSAYFNVKSGWDTNAWDSNVWDLILGPSELPFDGQASIAFYDNNLLIGQFRPGFESSRVIAYRNDRKIPDWHVLRTSGPVVDITRVTDIQLYNRENNTTLDTLDYIDPLQGKLLGAVMQNLDYISDDDPAEYNSSETVDQGQLVWGETQLGKLWFNTSNVRFVNYHQDGVDYNAEYWGTVFPGSDVAVYTWIKSDVEPQLYTGPGVVFDINSYAIELAPSATGALVPVYYYWVRNVDIVSSSIGKTLSDAVLASYIADPKSSGISYFAPIRPNVYGIYNSSGNINDETTVIHIGYGKGRSDDEQHVQVDLIRANYKDDFLSGLPANINLKPTLRYKKFLDSFCGIDDIGQIIPDPYLPMMKRSGIDVRPRQSFFYDNRLALKNYLQYTNSVLIQYPIIETKEPSLLYLIGPDYDTTKYWEFVNWWIPGYNDSVKASVQVKEYYQLQRLSVMPGIIAKVLDNGLGRAEWYIFTETGTWKRIGLERGTIQFKDILWDYAGNYGWDGPSWDTNMWDEFPYRETRNILRAINEQLFIEELVIHRNKALILMFEYIESEAIESQNYLTWLNKTSFIDVEHTVSELFPTPVYRGDSQEFLSGYIYEVKPYHVVIKEFLFKYTAFDKLCVGVTDFDLPAQYNPEFDEFISPQLKYGDTIYPNKEYPIGDPIWLNPEYTQWYRHYGLQFAPMLNYQIGRLNSDTNPYDTIIPVNTAYSYPINGVVRIEQYGALAWDMKPWDTVLWDELTISKIYEEVQYSFVSRAAETINNSQRGYNETTALFWEYDTPMYMDLPPITVMEGARGYLAPPRVRAIIDTTIYPAPRVEAEFEAILAPTPTDGNYVVQINTLNPGSGYVVTPKIVIDPAQQFVFQSVDVNAMGPNTITLPNSGLRTGDRVYYTVGAGTTPIAGVDLEIPYYVRVLMSGSLVIALYRTLHDCLLDQNRVELFNGGSGLEHILNFGAIAVPIMNQRPVRGITTTQAFDRTSYRAAEEWQPNRFYGRQYPFRGTNVIRPVLKVLDIDSTNPTVATLTIDYAWNGSLLDPAHTDGVRFNFINSAGKLQEVYLKPIPDTVSPPVPPNIQPTYQNNRVQVYADPLFEQPVPASAFMNSLSTGFHEQTAFTLGPTNIQADGYIIGDSIVASINGTTMTVTSSTFNSLEPGQVLYGGDVIPGTTIMAGAGGPGTYTVSPSQILNSTAMTTSGYNLVVSSVTGVLQPGQVLSGPGIAPNTTILGTGNPFPGVLPSPNIPPAFAATVGTGTGATGTYRVSTPQYVKNIGVGPNITVVNSNITLSSVVGLREGDPISFNAINVNDLNTFETYYIATINGNDITLQGNGQAFPQVGSGQLVSGGGYLFPSLPIVYAADRVRYGSMIYKCVVSANYDSTFIQNHWKPVPYTMNAPDRIMCYYEPTVNMHGKDLTQLMEGIRYPNDTYHGNKFDTTYLLNTIIQDPRFGVAPVSDTILGSAFPYGYGPEELVAGLVSDAVNIIVTSKDAGGAVANQFRISLDPVGYQTVWRETLSPPVVLQALPLGDFETDELILDDITKVIRSRAISGATVAGEFPVYGLNPAKIVKVDLPPGFTWKVTSGDSISIQGIGIFTGTIYFGNEVYIQSQTVGGDYVMSELLAFTDIDIARNALKGLRRGLSGTTTNPVIPVLTTVQPVLDVPIYNPPQPYDGMNRLDRDYVDMWWYGTPGVNPRTDPAANTTLLTNMHPAALELR